MALIRLIYRSENALSVSGSRIYVHYHDIVSTARRRNKEFDVTGFLMFDRARYHQILEGEAAAVDRLYASIQRDPRHHNIETMSRTEITSRGFPDWSMGSFLSGGKPHPVQARHGIANAEPISGDVFLKFALDFVTAEPDAA
jgi:hypothetical protein